MAGFPGHFFGLIDQSGQGPWTRVDRGEQQRTMTIEIDFAERDVLPRLHDPEFLIFIRHGQTNWNAEGRMQGQKDIPLNELGRSQARDNGRRLKAYLDSRGLDPQAFDFVASPMGRTRETMELLREAMALPPEGYRLDDQLKELTFGAWEGSTIPELADAAPDLVAARRMDKWGFVPPGGGESYAMLTHRIGRWLISVDRPTIVVAHGGVFRSLRGLLEGIETAMVPKLDVPQDQVFVWQSGAMTAL